MKRITMIDSLRGFSLLGILLANLLMFQYGTYGSNYPEVYNVSPFGTSLIQLIKIMFEGSTMPIFAFLFGFGMYKMAESCARRGIGMKRAMIRRATGLFVLGLLHVLFFFEGDILIVYSFITILTLWLLRRSVKTMVTFISVVTITLIISTFFVDMALIPSSASDIKLTEEMHLYLLEQKEVYSSGTPSELLEFAMKDDPFFGDLASSSMLFVFLIAVIMYLPVFISGMLAAKLKIFERPMTNFTNKLIYLVPIGLVINMICVLSNKYVNLLFIGDLLLSYGYIALFYKLYKDNVVMRAFEAVGKLSLTNYIMQSVFHSWLYYSKGLGRFGDANFELSVIIAILFFVTQVVLSALYLKAFKIGPLEYILRVWTYLTFKPHKKNTITS